MQLNRISKKATNAKYTFDEQNATGNQSHFKYLRINTFFKFNSTMPKEKESLEVFLKSLVKKHPSDLSTDGQILYCKICETNVALPSQKRFHATQHISTKKHSQLKERQKTSQPSTSSGQCSQQLITSALSTKTSDTQYASDLSEALIAGKYSYLFSGINII